MGRQSVIPTYEYIWIILYGNIFEFYQFNLHVTNTLNSYLFRIKRIRKVKYSFKKSHINIISSFSQLLCIFYCTLFLKSH